MTSIQTAILSILEAHREPLLREEIIALLPAGMKCAKRTVQEHIRAIERGGYAIISGDSGYELVTPERNNLDLYEHSILTLYAHAESEREAADRKYSILKRIQFEQRRASRAAIQGNMFEVGA